MIRHMEEPVFQMTFHWLVYFLQQEQSDLPMVQTRYIADLSQEWSMQSTTNQNCDLFINIFYKLAIYLKKIIIQDNTNMYCLKIDCYGWTIFVYLFCIQMRLAVICYFNKNIYYGE